MADLTPSVWPQSPLPWERAPQGNVIVWTFPSLQEVTADTHEQALAIAFATYVRMRWPLNEWETEVRFGPTNWENAAWTLLAPIAWILFLLLFV